MADLLGAANRVPGYDSANNNRAQPAPVKPNDPQVQNVPDPTRVSRADGRTERQDAGNALQSNVLRYDSNLQTFLEQLRQAPDLAQAMGKVLLQLRGVVSTPGLQEGVAKELAEFLQMIQLDADGFRQLFLEQVQAGNRFSGALFSLLRRTYYILNGEQARMAILEFAKRYADYSATDHIGKGMLSLLKQMPGYLPQSWRGGLEEMTARLENGLAAGARAENLALIQQEIIPYLGDYVERSHDLGALRALLNLLVLSTARYENGAEGPMLLAFRQLGSFGGLLGGLNNLDDAAVLKLLQDSDAARAADSAFVQGFAKTADQALKGNFGSDARESFAQMLQALLINESVYMPLNHMFFPVNWNGKMMYSELWVDPDAEDESSGGGKPSDKVQFLFKLDLESLGFLEITLAARDDQVELHIYGPDAVCAHNDVVTGDMARILARHQLTGSSIQVSKMEAPLTLTQVFPNLFEGKQGVNVKV